MDITPETGHREARIHRQIAFTGLGNRRIGIAYHRAGMIVRHNIDTLDRVAPQWLDVNAGEFKATVRDLPLREQIDVPVREQLIVELYSK